jgi:hypothetical protein
MSKELIQLLMQLITTLVTQQVNRKSNSVAAAGFINIDEATNQAEDDDSAVEIAKQDLAAHLGCSVDELNIRV